MLIIIFWPLYKNSYTPKNSRITWPLFSDQTSFDLAYYEAILAFISVLASIELAHYLATLLKIWVRRARALLGHIILSQIPKSSRITWPLYIKIQNSRIILPPYLGQISFDLAHHAAIFAFISVLASIELTNYLAT